MNRRVFLALLTGIFSLTLSTSPAASGRREVMDILEVSWEGLQEEEIDTSEGVWVEVDVRIEVERRNGSSGRSAGRRGTPARDIDFQWPIEWKGATSSWGYRRDPVTGEKKVKHSGIDLKAGVGTPVYAPADGVVRMAGWMNGYGWIVILDHAGGYSTRFAHLSKYMVEKGQSIERGSLIAETGSSGRSTGPHLHFEIRRDEVALNPIDFKNEVASREESGDETGEVVMNYQK